MLWDGILFVVVLAAGLGVLLSMAGTMAVLAWCLVSVCQNLDGKD